MRQMVAAVVLALTPLATASAGWWDDLDKGEPIRLADLTAQPERWKGKVVTFTCIYHGFDSVYQPYFTSFNAEKWFNVTAWLDGAPIWEEQAFREQDFPFLYLERSHPQRDELLRLEAYTRIEVTGRVKEVYRQRPFVEILGFRTTPSTFGKKVADWMVRGDRQASLGDYAKAEANYRLVLAQVTLDETTRLRAQKRLEEALRAAGRTNEPEAKAAPVLGGSTMPTPRSRRPAPEVPEVGGTSPLTPDGQLPGEDPFARGGGTPVTRLPAGGPAPAGAAPSAVTTDDLPGTPVDGHPGPATPGPAVPPNGAPDANPAARPAPPAACPPSSPAEPAPAPECPAGSAAPGQAPDAAPPAPPSGTPPPRSPRLSGVR